MIDSIKAVVASKNNSHTALFFVGHIIRERQSHSAKFTNTKIMKVKLCIGKRLMNDVRDDHANNG